MIAALLALTGRGSVLLSRGAGSLHAGTPGPHRTIPAGARRSCRVLYSAHRFLDKRADPLLIGSGQLRQCELGWPHAAFVELGLVAEAERRIPALELVRALEETDDLAILGIRGHPIPGSRRQGWCAGFDDRVKPFGHGAIPLGHLGDLREHIAFTVCVARERRLRLSGALPHRGSFV